MLQQRLNQKSKPYKLALVFTIVSSVIGSLIAFNNCGNFDVANSPSSSIGSGQPSPIGSGGPGTSAANNAKIAELISRFPSPAYTPPADFKWSGPQAQIDFSGRVPRIIIDGQSYDPVFPSVNMGDLSDDGHPTDPTVPNGPDSNYVNALAQIDAAIANGQPLVDIYVPYMTFGYLQKLNFVLGNRDIKIWLRYPTTNLLPNSFNQRQIPLARNGNATKLDNSVLDGGYVIHDASVVFNGKQLNCNDQNWFFSKTIKNSLSAQSAKGVDPNCRMCAAASGCPDLPPPEYITYDEESLTNAMNEMQSLLSKLESIGLSKKIIGIRPLALSGGEYFRSPLPGPNVKPGYEGSAWAQPDDFYLGDYSPREDKIFSTWISAQGLRFNDSAPQTGSLPSVAARTTGALGDGLVLSSSTGARSYAYEKFTSERIVWYQVSLAKALKALTKNKALFMINNLYLFQRDLSGSSHHTAADYLLAASEIDAISSPYMYNKARSPGGAFQIHGPIDTAALSRKLWVTENDSKPYWDHGAGDFVNGNNTFSLADDLAMQFRNELTTIFHKATVYHFDLIANMGWFGRASVPQEVNAIWATAQLSNATARALNQYAGADLVYPEIAIFIDDDSYNLVSRYGLGGPSTFGFTPALIRQTYESLYQMGAPVVSYRINDLDNPSLDLSKIKAAFFLNTTKLTTHQKDLIKTRLMNNGRYLFFEHAVGLYDENLKPDIRLMNGFLRLQLQMATGPNQCGGTCPKQLVSTILTNEEDGSSKIEKIGVYPTQDANGIPFQAPFPGFFGSPLGNYGVYVDRNDLASTFVHSFKDAPGGFSIVYSAHDFLNPDSTNGIGATFSQPYLKSMLAAAGVFFYSKQGVIVDGAGPYLMVHGSGMGLQTIKLRNPSQYCSVIQQRPSTLPQNICQNGTLQVDLTNPSTYLIMITPGSGN